MTREHADAGAVVSSAGHEPHPEGSPDGWEDQTERQRYAARPRPTPDFSRPVFCIFGVTFDNVTMDQALEMVLDAVRTRRACVVTTPNVHFVARSLREAAFRDSIVRSELSLVDGMPLVWAGRWFGVRVEGRVTGSDLFERMRRSRDAGERLKVYLFGGPAGVAQRAADKLNAEDGGLRCVGHHSPGYGSVEEISHPDIIREINASGADFLLVALGAAKGQSWIQHNRAALHVPVLSHLGAVINFTAGTIRRAPVWMQDAGLEWAWRIYREPALWRRYVSDGLVAFGMMARMSLHAAAAGLLALGASKEVLSKQVVASVAVTETEHDTVIAIRGDWTGTDLAPLRTVLHAHAASGKRLLLDLGAATALGSTAVALLMMLQRYRLDLGRGWHVVGASMRLRRICGAYGASDLVADTVADTRGGLEHPRTSRNEVAPSLSRR